MGYDTNPPPPVAVTMLGGRLRPLGYLTLGHSQNMYKSASVMWEASVTRASRGATAGRGATTFWHGWRLRAIGRV